MIGPIGPAIGVRVSGEQHEDLNALSGTPAHHDGHLGINTGCHFVDADGGLESEGLARDAIGAGAYASKVESPARVRDRVTCTFPGVARHELTG